VSQINAAVIQLNQSTQQNASSAEELASTSEEMSSQAEQLQQTMSFFKLDGSDAAQAQSQMPKTSLGSGRRQPQLKLAASARPPSRRAMAVSDDVDESPFTRFTS
jgi:methyl-accepting chemotaxis protein